MVSRADQYRQIEEKSPLWVIRDDVGHQQARPCPQCRRKRK